MYKHLAVLPLLLCLVAPVLAEDADDDAGEAAAPRVMLATNFGEIVLELHQDKAPQSVENFLQYVRDGHYDGTVFHRVIDNFMIQGGGFTEDLRLKPTRPGIQNEANNGLSNLRGTVAMARTNDPHSANAQFFVNVVDNTRLDFVSEQSGHTWGYTVFGNVVSGMEVVDTIRALETGAKGPFAKDVPVQAAIIERASILDGDGQD
jgi:peptidyl-prolyl cis-trans isomerase A (cyclophilin A)